MKIDISKDEIWQPVYPLGYPYFVSSHGRVRNRETGKILKPTKQSGGYWYVSLYGNGKRIGVAVHRLVARSFVLGYADGLTVNHIDGVKSNNIPENLEWVTTAENNRHSYYSLGNQSIAAVKSAGFQNGNCKITPASAKLINELYQRGTLQREIAETLGVHEDTISRFIRRASFTCEPLERAAKPQKTANVSCGECGEMIYRRLSHVKRSKTGNCFCSKSCSVRARNKSKATARDAARLCYGR